MTHQALPTFDPSMEWLQTIGVAGFLFFLFKGLAWLVLFWLIGQGIVRKHTVAKAKLRWRKFWKRGA